jgi:hypothetical protein
MLPAIILGVMQSDGRWPKCHYVQCHFAECSYSKCHNDKCRYAECRGACCLKLTDDGAVGAPGVDVLLRRCVSRRKVTANQSLKTKISTARSRASTQLKILVLLPVVLLKKREKQRNYRSKHIKIFLFKVVFWYVSLEARALYYKTFFARALRIFVVS